MRARIVSSWASVMIKGGARRMLHDEEQGDVSVGERGRERGRRESEDAHVDVRRLGEDALALHDEAQVPRRPAALALGLVDDDGVEEALAADLGDPAAVRADRLELAQAGAHLVAHRLGARREVLLDDDLERGLGNGARERVLQGG